MEIIQASKLIEILNSSSPKKIGILDNNTISFLSNINKYAYTDKFLVNYDLLLIPNWVYEEVQDSPGRISYLEYMLEKNVAIFIINEVDYEELAEYKSEWIYKFFLYSSFLIGELKSFIKRNIEKNQPIEDLEDYEVWVKLLYEEGFQGEILKSGRSKKKNAGEISISVLALIIAYTYYKNNHTVTILSNDRGTYDFIKNAIFKLSQDSLFKGLVSSVITFKSNDFIIKESYSSNFLIEGYDIYSIIEFRDEKRVKYTKSALDRSIEEYDGVLSNGDFIKSLKDSTFNIIF